MAPRRNRNPPTETQTTPNLPANEGGEVQNESTQAEESPETQAECSHTQPDIEDAELERIVQEQERESKRLALQLRKRQLEQLIANQRRQMEDTSRTTQWTLTGNSEEFTGDANDSATSISSSSSSSSNQGASKRPPARPATQDTYYGKNMQEFITLMARLKNHHRLYSSFFSNDAAKVADTVQYLSSPLIRLWDQKQNELKRDATWEEFKDFLLRQLNDPIHLKREANYHYQTSKQRPHQSVWEFVAFISQWEAQLTQQYTEPQRIEHLRARLLPEIQSEALKYPTEPDTYDSFVTHMQSIESNIPARKSRISRRDNSSLAP